MAAPPALAAPMPRASAAGLHVTLTSLPWLSALQDCKAQTPAPGKLKEYAAYLAAEGTARQDVQQLAQEVHDFSCSFDMPGGDW